MTTQLSLSLNLKPGALLFYFSLLYLFLLEDKHSYGVGYWQILCFAGAEIMLFVINLLLNRDISFWEDVIKGPCKK